MHTSPEAATVDPLREFRTNLSPRVNSQMQNTARATVLVHRATTLGWTAATLAAECMRNHHGVANPAGVVMHRLEWAAENPPAITGTPKKHQGCCDNGWIYNETTSPPTVMKCMGVEVRA